MSAQAKVLIIIIDAARRDDTELILAQSRVKTLASAARATLIAPSCWTVPSVASLLTGLFPAEHGRQWPLDRLPPSPPSLVDFLARAGRQALVVSANEMYCPPILDFPQGSAVFPLQRHSRLVVGLRRTLGHLDYGGKLVLAEVQRLIADKRVPDLLMVHLNEAHHPYLPPPDGSLSTWLAYSFGHIAYYMTRRAQVWEFAARATPRAWEKARRRYHDCLRYSIGIAEQIVEAYEAANLIDSTLLILTADHGEHLGEHGLADHQASLYEEVINVPCLLHAPELPPPEQIGGPFQHTDIALTVGNYLGVTLDGYSPGWKPLDMLEPANWQTGHPHAFMEWHAWGETNLASLQRRNPSYDFSPLNYDLVGVRTAQWKLIYRADGTQQLYNIANDPGETTELSDNRPEVVSALQARLAEWQRATARQAQGDGLADKERRLVEQRLSDLGYL
ncbi:MAG: sulfatase family protein [Candidatus Zipacnadales bacterium]